MRHLRDVAARFASLQCSAGRLLVMGRLLLAVSCATDTSRSPSPVAAKALPRYWLQDTELFDEPKGRKTHHVQGPELVELLASGQVRSLPDARLSFEGYLPEMLLYLPGEYGRGLLRYAQRTAELHVDRPSGAPVGFIHPGAFVTVVPGDDAYALIELPEFVRDGQAMVAFVERSALGFEPHELTVPKRTEKGKSLLGQMIHLPVGNLNCRDVWFSLESRAVWQYVEGVDLRFDSSGSFYLFPSPTRLQSRGNPSHYCPAHVVFREGAVLHLGSVQERFQSPSKAIPAVPAGYEVVRLDEPDPLAEAIMRGRSISWLVDEEISTERVQVSCRRWTFKWSKGGDRTARRLEGRLLGPQWQDEGKTVIPYHPFTYELSDGKSPARLHLDHIVTNRWEGPYTSDFSLLAAHGDELRVMGRPIPDSVVAYDPNEVERWYLTPSACEAARRSAIERLERDPALSTQIGFHAASEP